MNARIAITAIAAAGALGAGASAGTVNMKYLGKGEGRDVRFSLGGSAHNVFAGQLKHQITGGVGPDAGFNGQHITFCTDLTEFVTSTYRPYQVVGVENVPIPAMGEDRANAIEDIFRFADGAQFVLTGADDFAAAFQIAVWEIVNDFSPVGGRSSLDVAVGAFKAMKTDGTQLGSVISGHLNDLFNSIGSFPRSTPPPFVLVGLHNDGCQDQIILVPLPTASFLAGAGLIGLCATRRRRPV